MFQGMKEKDFSTFIYKQITFHMWKNLFEYILFQWLHFCISDPISFQKFWLCTLTLDFFFSCKYSKNTCLILFVLNLGHFNNLLRPNYLSQWSQLEIKKLACNASFNMSYCLLEFVKIWQIFLPSRLELLKTHHCTLVCPKMFKLVNWCWKQVFLVKYT